MFCSSSCLCCCIPSGGCAVEAGVAPCLLTPSASPGETEQRVLNGDVCVKVEKCGVDPVDWSVADVVSYFTAAGFGEQAGAFRNQEIDGKSLLLMQRSDVLKGLSIRLGPALKIYEFHIKVLQRSHFQVESALC
ncbi:SAMD1 protein, partial [Polyodon spathula]|nr:SAMD1 protein [Polyodon spathula]